MSIVDPAIVITGHELQAWRDAVYGEAWKMSGANPPMLGTRVLTLSAYRFRNDLRVSRRVKGSVW